MVLTACLSCCHQAIKDASDRFEADPDCGAPPIMWDDATNTFVDMS